MIGPDGFPSDILINLVFALMSWIVAGGVVLVALNPGALLDQAQRRYLQRCGRLAPAWYEHLALLLALLGWPMVLVVLALKVAKAARR